MSKEKSPAFQWYPSDIQSDFRYRSLGFFSRGVYRDLLDFVWLEIEIPASQITKILGLEVAQWEEIKEEILSFFVVSSDGQIRHKRLDAERRKQRNFSKHQKKAGKASGIARRKTVEDKEQRTPVQLGSNRMATETNSSSSSSSSSSSLPPPSLPKEASSYARAREGEKEEDAPVGKTHVLWMDQKKTLLDWCFQTDPTGVVDGEDQEALKTVFSWIFRGKRDEWIVAYLLVLRDYDLGQVVWAAGDYVEKDKHDIAENDAVLFRMCVESDDGGFQKAMERKERGNEKKIQERRNREREDSAARDTGGAAGFDTAGDVLRNLPALQRPPDSEEKLCTEKSDNE